MSLVWINGHLIDKADARVSPFDHGFLYGDGVWEPLRVFRGALFRPADHLAKLLAAAGAVNIDIPLSLDELTAAIETAVRANNRTEGYVRVIVTRGPGTIGPDPRKLDPQVIVTAEEYLPFPHELHGHGLHAVVAPVSLSPDNPAHRVRTLSQLHIVLAKMHALRHGCLEAVLLNNDGTVATGTEGELGLVRAGSLVIHEGDPVEGDPVEPMTRTVVELAREAGVPAVSVRGYSLDDLRAADEVFLAGTSCGVIGIVRVDGKDIGSGTEGPITRALRERFRVLTRGE